MAIVREDTPRGLVGMGWRLNDRLGDWLKLIGEEVVVAARLRKFIHGTGERGGWPVRGIKSSLSVDLSGLSRLLGISIGLDLSSAIANTKWVWRVSVFG